MMVVMTPGASQEQVDAVVARLETTGVHVVVMPGELTTAIGAIGDPAGVAEQYPQLRATENFQRLQAQLTETEDEIQAARRIYNSNVRIYNTRIQIFPNSLVAARGDFEPREFFEIEVASDREVPQVSFT